MRLVHEFAKDSTQASERIVRLAVCLLDGIPAAAFNLADDGHHPDTGHGLRVGSGQWYAHATVGIHNGLAAIAMTRGDFDDAKEHLDSALPMAEALIRSRPAEPAAIALLASTHDHIARLNLEIGDTRAAALYAMLAAEGHRTLAEADPKHVGWQQAVADDQHFLRRVGAVSSERRPAP